MERMMKKLSLWHTKTFRPIMTHDELEPIMVALGFVALPSPPPSAPGQPPAWREYAFHVVHLRPGGNRRHRQPQPPARPRLPASRIDGLHLLTYRAFIDAVGAYLGSERVGDHFHVRSMPLHRVHDRGFNKVFRHMSDDRRPGGADDGLLVYREGTLDQTTLLLCNDNNNDGNPAGGGGSPPGVTCMVSLHDIIPGQMKDIAAV